MKIRYTKDNVKRHLNLKQKDKFNSFFMCILAFMLNFEIYFLHKYKTTKKN